MRHLPRKSRRAFTLVELLVVIGIIAVLIGILLPALTRARQQARSVQCLSNLRSISQALVAYSVDNHNYIVPAYNLPFAPGATTNFTGGPDQPMDGWAGILDRDGYLKGSRPQADASVFYCPETYDIPAVEAGATGSNGGAPRGWVDWPMIFTVVGGDTNPKQPVLMPKQGFNKILRVSYWMNAYHPTGQTLTAAQIGQRDLYYSTVVGFGPSMSQQIRAHKVSQIRHSSRTITIADGVFLGRQSVDGQGMTNSTIGYHHRGPSGPAKIANAAFADGHAEPLTTGEFPCAYATTSTYTANGGHTTFADQIQQNTSGNTIYLQPEAALEIFRAANPGAN